MAAQKKYPDELRERAVKTLFEVREREGKGHGELARVARETGRQDPGHTEISPLDSLGDPAGRHGLAGSETPSRSPTYQPDEHVCVAVPFVRPAWVSTGPR
jgi:hypothetical protein